MKRYWIAFTAVIFVGFLVLGWAGWRIYQEKPPIPETVMTTDGKIIIASGEIGEGQNVWQAMGGMELGSVWGHGSYVAPDWSADWLHRECVFILNSWSKKEFGKIYADLIPEQKALLQSRLTEMMRKNTYDAVTGKIVIDSIRAAAFEANVLHYSEVFSKGKSDYAIPSGALNDPVKLRQLSAFFFWTSWAASTNRPGDDITYTSNWPHEDLVNNHPTPDAVVWTGVSIILLLAGIGAMIWYHASHASESLPPMVPNSDPLFNSEHTPSQKATLKYFFVVSALILVQIFVGIITAHYGVEGNGFYGIPMSKWLPYVVTRTWHVQLGIFWIATAWLAAGLYIAPAVSGLEMKGQRFGVNVLFGALLLVVVGSMTGEWLSVNHKLSGDAWFYFGHQGYEYVDLGRVWQIALTIGLVLWVYLLGRNIFVAIRRKDEHRSLLALFLIAAVAIGGFYMAGLMWGKHTNLAIAEYWRWWVVHLWVEGFFEVFATVVIIFMFARLKLIRVKTANTAVILSSTVYLSGGIIGTLHHLYFSGTPTPILAFGAVFSALEVVPLVLAGFEAWENIQLSRAAEWVKNYKWPIYFFISVAFWNMIGAGLFGFMINPPIALYYMQGLNTTPVHGHAALFGVYGMLGIGLMLFCLRIMWVQKEWKEKMLKFSFWSLNIGLMAMVVGSLLPVGLMQTWASVKYGYWYARSSEFLHLPMVETIKWSRIFGDTIFAFGALALVLFVFGLITGHSLKKEKAK
ncbi:MAG: nitric-oxide reductase large subunit [Ignavibacteriales bacterium]|nr:nitric-oxide reductase large subunit [Ignavibacteriales bacterium]